MLVRQSARQFESNFLNVSVICFKHEPCQCFGKRENERGVYKKVKKLDCIFGQRLKETEAFFEIGHKQNDHK